MKPVIEQLRAEHVGMARLLNVLECQLHIIERAGEPDYAIIEDIVLYFLDFPDTCHHPKEDMIVRRLLETAPERSASLAGLADMHRDLAEMSAAVATVIGRVLNEEVVPRAQVVRTAQDFIVAQRLHMQMEEDLLLPLAAEVLGDAELAALASAIFAPDCAPGRAKAEQRYARLKQTVLDWAHASGGAGVRRSLIRVDGPSPRQGAGPRRPPAARRQ